MPTPSTAYQLECAADGSMPAAPSPMSAMAAIAMAHVPVAEPEVPVDVPSDYIPGLYSLGSTYNVLNGKYADSRSTMQQVVDWTKSAPRTQEFGGKEYSVPRAVNFARLTTADYRSSYGKTTSEYSKSLSAHAGLEASFPGFSASASADYSESQRENLSHAFTRVTYAVTHYILSLPPAGQIKSLLKPWFVNDLDNMEPIELYKVYGTHLLRSLTVGGRATFLFSTDTRTYHSETSLEVAAKLSASYLVASGSVEMSLSQKQAMESFNESSETSINTKGGDPSFGNEHFLKNVQEWAKSIIEYPEFVDFGSLPCFVGIWEFATSQARRDELQRAYAQFVTLYTQDLSMPGPYLHARLSDNFDDNKDACLSVGTDGESGHVVLKFPTTRSDGWYFISPAISGTKCVLAKDLVPGALAPVKWVEAYVGPYNQGDKVTRFWRAVPPTSDYVALGCVAMMGNSAREIPSQPPAELASQFRAVHKRALTGAVYGVLNWIYSSTQNRKIFAVDTRYWFADLEIPLKGDCYVLDPQATVKDWSGW
ncbi:MAC/Perforin domain-containing protein [Cytidiella melzeri]|nr:MAC/Perforin domain-containing protein [Cytidiella melzeri]